MSTTTITTEPCTVHGVRHREGSKVAIACAASTSPPPVRSVDLVTVSVEQLETVLSCWGGRLARIVMPGGTHLVMAGAFTVGETIADRADVLGMRAYYGSLQRAAAILTAELRLEQEAEVAA